MKHFPSGRRDFLRVGLAGAAAVSPPFGRAMAQPVKLTLDDVNKMSLDAFVAAFGDVIEFTPAAAKNAYTKRPFATVNALHEALFETGSKCGNILLPFALIEASGAFAFACQPYLAGALTQE